MDPSADEVAQDIATLQAFEHAREAAVAASTQPQVAEHAAAVEAAITVLAAPVVVVAIDPYLARSVKSSPNGF